MPKMEFISVKLQAYSIQIAHYFRELFQNFSFPKRTFFKKFMVQHHFNRVQPCSVHPTLLPKPELTFDLTEEALKIHPWWKLFSAKMQVQSSFPAILLKTNSTTGIIWHGFCKVPSLIFWKTFFEVSLLFLLYRRL